MTYDERVTVMVELTPSGRVLHLGACGNLKPTSAQWPHFAHAALVEAGRDVLATDIHEAGLAWMRAEGYETAFADATALTYDSEFDAVFAGELIEHLDDPAAFLDGCARALRPEGVLILSTPQPFAPLHLLLYVLRFGDGFNLEHVAWYDRQTLGQLLGRHGFEIIETRFVNDLRPGGRSMRVKAMLATQRLVRGRFKTTMVVAARLTGNTAHVTTPDYSESWR